MSLYQKMQKEPLKVKIKKEVKDVVFETVSSMCDNKHTFRMKKNEQGEFKLNTCGYAYSNFGIKTSKIDLEWLADAGKWQDIINEINGGYQRVFEVKQR